MPAVLRLQHRAQLPPRPSCCPQSFRRNSQLRCESNFQVRAREEPATVHLPRPSCGAIDSLPGVGWLLAIAPRAPPRLRCRSAACRAAKVGLWKSQVAARSTPSHPGGGQNVRQEIPYSYHHRSPFSFPPQSCRERHVAVLTWQFQAGRAAPACGLRPAAASFALFLA